MRNAGSDQLVEVQAVAKIHDRACRQMDFARDRRDVVPIPPREIADKPKHPAPFVAVGAALPLVAQIVLVFLHPRDQPSYPFTPHRTEVLRLDSDTCDERLEV